MFGKLVDYMQQTPMYRSILFFLLTILAVAVGLSVFGILPYNPINILAVTGYLAAVCWASNWVLAKLFGAKTNPDSTHITALILALIFGPMPLVGNLLALTFLGVAASASKYLLVWQRNHIFNPAAFAAVATAVVFGMGASWWVGSIYLLPVVFIGGVYEMWKINRGHLAISFLGAYAVFFMGYTVLSGSDVTTAAETLWRTLLYSPILFFTFIMLTEPFTSPARQNLRIYYGIVTALAVVALPAIFPRVPYTLELSLLAGNAFTALLAGQGRLGLTLKKVERLSSNISGFWFRPDRPARFLPGQFVHYTLPHSRADMRGARRFFTIASSPTEQDVLLVTKFANKSSSFKSALQFMGTGDGIAASRPEGEFVLPDDTSRPLVFIAGGIGITPFRSIVKYLIDIKQQRPITLIYGARTPQDIVFRSLFDKAGKALGMKTVYAVSDPPKGWQDEHGHLTPKLIQKHTKGLKNPLYYLSGPEPMVRSLIRQLKRAGVPADHIKHDYFTGYTKRD